jgi:hypothetical protein
MDDHQPVQHPQHNQATHKNPASLWREQQQLAANQDSTESMKSTGAKI